MVECAPVDTVMYERADRIDVHHAQAEDLTASFVPAPPTRNFLNRILSRVVVRCVVNFDIGENYPILSIEVRLHTACAIA